MTRRAPILLLLLLCHCGFIRDLIRCEAPLLAAATGEVLPRAAAALATPGYRPAVVDSLRNEGAGIGWAALACAVKAIADALAERPRIAALAPRSPFQPLFEHLAAPSCAVPPVLLVSAVPPLAKQRAQDWLRQRKPRFAQRSAP